MRHAGMTSPSMPTVTKSILILGFLLAGSFITVGLVRSLLLIITIHGRSMQPTLDPGDRALVLRRWPTRWLRHNQLVVLSYPPIEACSQSSRLFIKRLTNLSGEIVVTHLADLPDVWQKRQEHLYDKMGQRVWTVPPGHYFVCADGIGVDSQVWGPLPLTSLVGVVVARLPRKATQQLPAAAPDSP